MLVGNFNPLLGKYVFLQIKCIIYKRNIKTKHFRVFDPLVNPTLLKGGKFHFLSGIIKFENIRTQTSNDATSSSLRHEIVFALDSKNSLILWKIL